MPDGQIKTEKGTTPSTEPEGLVVRYRYGEGILLHGDTYPHKDAIKKAIPRWRWFRSMQQWGVTATRDRAMTREAVKRYADGLTKAGLPGVRVDYEAPKPEDVRPAAELFEERQRRSRERAEAASQRAARLEQEAASHYEASHDAVRHIPMGQPILRGHHSQGKHERAVQRADAAMGRSIRAQQDAERAHARAQGSKAQAAARESPDFVIRRLRELANEARELEVRLTGEAPPDWRGLAPRGPATGDDRSMLLTRQREVEERSAHFRSLLEEAHVPAMQIAPRPMELVITERGPATTVKTTPKMMKVKRGGRVVTVARDWVWLPKAILALRDEHPLTGDEVLMLWKAQHDGTTRALSPEQHDALESLVEMGLMVPHPDMKYSGLYLATNRGKAIELPEGKPKTWLKRWDGLRAAPAPEGPQMRPPVPPEASAEPQPQAKPEVNTKPGPQPKTEADADRLAEKLGLERDRTPEIGRMREAMVSAVREGLGQEMKVWFIRHTQ
ncbi:MAG: DUF3560 domain-containing protein, partial [Myxococcales bacterium]|nr:DUF3560 domain-containing protein [Myxococcales bacterium]